MADTRRELSSGDGRGIPETHLPPAVAVSDVVPQLYKGVTCFRNDALQQSHLRPEVKHGCRAPVCTMYVVNQYVCVDILPSVFNSNRKKGAENTDEVMSTLFAKVCLSVRFVMKLVLALKIFMISSTEFKENPQDGFVADYRSRRADVVFSKDLMFFFVQNS